MVEWENSPISIFCFLRSLQIWQLESYVLKLNEREKELEKDILLIEQNLTDDKLDILTKKQEEILEIRKNRLKGQCIRSKSKWIEEGEKPTKYFINLETQNYVSKQIPNIEKDDGSVIFDQMEILHETKCFYENLF